MIYWPHILKKTLIFNDKAMMEILSLSDIAGLKDLSSVKVMFNEWILKCI